MRHVVVAACCVMAMIRFGDSANAQTFLEGRVIDARTREPVAEARIALLGTARIAETGTDGRWRLSPGIAGPYRLRIERVGYSGVERMIHAGAGGLESTPLVIALEPLALAVDALVVSASRRAQRLADAPVTVELISRTELVEAGAVDLATILGERSGLELDAGHPSGTGVMVRGFGSERVLVLLDGQPLTGRLSGNFDIARLPASMLERVEIVKGPQSTLYGSDAIGGVINLITRSPDTNWNAAFDLTGGSDARRSAGARLQAQVLGAAVSLDGGRRSIQATPGEVSATGAVTEQWDGLLRLSRNTSIAVFDATLMLVDERQRWRTGQLYTFADNTQIAARLGGTIEHDVHRLNITGHASAFDHLSRRSNSDTPPRQGDQETQRIGGADVLYNLEAGRHSLDGGLELRHEGIRSGRVTGGERSLDGVAGFAQYTFAAGAVSLVPGTRVSWNEAWGAHLTPRLAMMMRAADGVSIRASAGTAFRAPAFKELYMQFVNVSPGVSYTVRGNPDLVPETSTSFTAGAELARGRWYTRLQLFHNAFDDFIETREVGDSSGLSLITYGNLESGTTRGVEFEAGAYWKALRGEFSYNRLDAFAEGGAPLLGSPAHSAHARVSYTTPFGTRLAVSSRYVGRTPIRRDDAGAVTSRPAFARFDARVAQRMYDRVELAFGVENILDETPAHWPALTGRHIYASLSWHAGPTFRSLQEN